LPFGNRCYIGLSLTANLLTNIYHLAVDRFNHTLVMKLIKLSIKCTSYAWHFVSICFNMRDLHPTKDKLCYQSVETYCTI